MKKFSDQEKYQLVERYYNGESASNICLEQGLARSTFYTWLKPYKTTHTGAGTCVSPAEFVKMKKKVERQEQMIAVLQKVNCTYSAPLKNKLYELERLHGQFSVHVLCDALGVSRGTFYNHIFRNKKQNTSYQMRRTQLSEKILKIYNDSNQIFGAKKIKVILANQGVHAGEKMVSELMREMNLTSIRSDAKKNYKRTIDQKKKDVLKLDFTAKAPNQVWVSDITYFKLKNKFYYICVILDLYSRKAIAYKISKRLSTQIATSTFKTAYAKRKPGPGLTFHSDRGAQYTSDAFQKLLNSFHITQSFSPSGRPCHNAVMESFFSTLKNEELYRTTYHSEAEFKDKVGRYIHFYNIERPHATLQHKTPDAYERLFYEHRNKT